jgi:uncharacterized small protein (DUF1192 family)
MASEAKEAMQKEELTAVDAINQRIDVLNNRIEKIYANAKSDGYDKFQIEMAASRSQ